jgi:hypothetical protein
MRLRWDPLGCSVASGWMEASRFVSRADLQVLFSHRRAEGASSLTGPLGCVRRFRNGHQWPRLSRSEAVHQRARRLAQCRPGLLLSTLSIEGTSSGPEPAARTTDYGWLAVIGWLVAVGLVVLLQLASGDHEGPAPVVSEPPSSSLPGSGVAASRESVAPVVPRPRCFVFDVAAGTLLGEETAMAAAWRALAWAGQRADLWEPVGRLTPYAGGLATVGAGSGDTEEFLERPFPADPNYGAIRFQHDAETRRVTLYLEGLRLTCTVYQIEMTGHQPAASDAPP